MGEAHSQPKGTPRDSWKTKHFNSSLLLSLGLARAPHWQSQQEAGGEVLNGCRKIGVNYGSAAYVSVVWLKSLLD